MGNILNWLGTYKNGITIIFSIIGGVALYIRYSHTKKLEYTAMERSKWRETIRQSLIVLIREQNSNKKNTRKIIKAQSTIKANLNPIPKEVNELDKKMWEVFTDDKYNITDQIYYTQLLLKFDWERAKKENKIMQIKPIKNKDYNIDCQSVNKSNNIDNGYSNSKVHKIMMSSLFAIVIVYVSTFMPFLLSLLAYKFITPIKNFPIIVFILWFFIVNIMYYFVFSSINKYIPKNKIPNMKKLKMITELILYFSLAIILSISLATNGSNNIVGYSELLISMVYATIPLWIDYKFL